MKCRGMGGEQKVDGARPNHPNCYGSADIFTLNYFSGRIVPVFILIFFFFVVVEESRLRPNAMQKRNPAGCGAKA